MSTYYYLACDVHREQCPTSSHGYELLPDFCYLHRSCKLVVFDEHDGRHDEYLYHTEASAEWLGLATDKKA